MIRSFLAALCFITLLSVIELLGWMTEYLFLTLPLGMILCVGLMIGFGIIILQGDIKNYKKELVAFGILLIPYIFFISQIIIYYS